MDENQIIAYLNGQLSPEEEDAFEAQMQTDAAFAKTVAAQEKIIKALRHKESDNFLAKIKAFEKTLPPIIEKEDDLSVPVINPEPIRKPGIIRRLVPWIAAAASIVLILIIGSYFLQPVAFQEVAAFDPNPIFVKRASASEDVLNFNSGITFLNQKKIPQAIGSLQLVNNESNLFLGSQYILAYCYFRAAQYETALQYLKKIEGKENQLDLLFGNYKNVDQKEIEWLTMLCLFGDKQQSVALRILNKIVADPTHPYHEKALEIKKRL